MADRGAVTVIDSVSVSCRALILGVCVLLAVTAGGVGVASAQSAGNQSTGNATVGTPTDGVEVDNSTIVGAVDSFTRVVDYKLERGTFRIVLESDHHARVVLSDVSGQSQGFSSVRTERVTVPASHRVRVTFTVENPANPVIFLSTSGGSGRLAGPNSDLLDGPATWRGTGAAGAGGLLAGTVPALYVAIKRRDEIRDDVERVI